MSQEERFDERDRHYGVWHRVKSITRYITGTDAKALTMADLDSVLFAEYEHPTKYPLCLVEVGRDIGQEKPAGVTRKLAQLAGIPAYVALYTPSTDPNPAGPDWPDIEQFRVRRLWPQPEESWRTLTPAQWAQALVQIRGWQLRRIDARQAANDSEWERAPEQSELFATGSRNA